MAATTIDPLHLIRIMPAQGSGCERTALGFCRMRMSPPFPVRESVGFLPMDKREGEKKMSDCLVVGGGIIGLSLAYELSRRGMSVTLVEQGEWGGQASSAAAGMLAPLKEFSAPGPMVELGMDSLRLYPQWAQELEEHTAGDVQLSLEGLVTVAMDEAESEQLRAKYLWQKEAGYDVHWMGCKELLEVEPLLTDRVQAGIYSPGEGHINNRLLLRSLVTACKIQGLRFCLVVWSKGSL